MIYGKMQTNQIVMIGTLFQDLIAKMKSCRTSPDIGFFNLLIKKRQFRRDYIQAKVSRHRNSVLVE